VTVHTHHRVCCDLCAETVTVLQGGGAANDATLRGWLIIAIEPLASAGTVRAHVCPDCATAAPALAKLAEPLGPLPVITNKDLPS
jgi:hypothetical protein